MPQTENIFPDKGPAAEPSVTAEKTLADCDNQVQTKAKATCEAMMSAEGDARNPETLETCMFDYCFAGRDFAAEDAIVIHEDEEAQAEA